MELATQPKILRSLQGGGEASELIHNFDWSKSPLGLPESWPQSLRTTLGVVLHSAFPMFLFWGPDLICFYNDAFRPSLGNDGKHPAIGKKGKTVWPEIWDFIYPLIHQVLTTGEPVWFEDQLVPFYRNGRIENIYWTFSYSPVYADDGNINGVFVTCTETTEKVTNFRQLQESKSQLEFSIEAAELATWDFDPLTNTFTANARFTQWFGIAAPEATDNNLALNVIAVEDRQRVATAYRQALDYAVQSKYDIEYTIRPQNHPERILRAKGKAWFNDAKIAYRFTGTLQDVTEQARARKSVEENEQRFRSLIEEATVASCLYIGRDMVIEIANKTMLNYWGKNENVIGKPLKEALPELAGQPFLQILDEVYTTGNAYQAREAEADLVINGVLGTYYFDFSYKALRKADGIIYGVMNTAVDVTENVLNRRKIETAEERARLAIESADLGTYEVDLQTDAIKYSDRFAAIWGVGQGISRAALAASIHPADQAFRKQALERSLITGSIEYEARLLWKDGTVHWVRVKGKVLYDAASRPVTLIGVSQDITEQKQFAEELGKQVRERTHELEVAQASLVQGNQYLQSVINNFDSALAVLVPIYENNRIVDFYFRMTNTAYTKYSGLSPEAIQHKRTGGVFPGYFQTEAFAKYVETFETGKPHTWDLHYNLDELDVYLKVSATKMRDEVVVNFFDFTVLKHLQLDLLEKVKELERSNANLEEFAHAASHDLKEPIRKIHFFTDKLWGQLAERLTADEQQTFSRIKNASDRMSTLVDDLLLYSHVSQKPHEKEVVDLNEKVKRVLEDLELDIEQKAATITMSPLPTVMGYRRQLQQLFQNLIGNALKYSKPGVAPDIRISAGKVTGKDAGFTSEMDAARTFHIIEVTDNGIGFEQKDAERIFNVFTRLHGNSEYRGTGVGLSIVRKVVENHGGYVKAESEPGNGATFKIYLP